MSEIVIDWSKYGRGKPRQQPDAQITYFEKDGKVFARAEFPAELLEVVAERIRQQLSYWRGAQ